jgi:predicted metal-dependent enzyme (double-stranded beta helix superfamily)
MATTPLFVPALESFEELVPHDSLLTPDELERIASDIAEREDIWLPLVRLDPDRRRYELVYEDERMDAWVLSWMPGQGTGFHDHYISGVGIAVAAGGVREDLLVYRGDDIALHLRAGDSRRGGPGYIHRVRHDAGEPAVTIHVYSPRLDWVGQYRLGDDGVVRREVRPGRNELTDQLIAAGALEHVLERF